MPQNGKSKSATAAGRDVTSSGVTQPQVQPHFGVQLQSPPIQHLMQCKLESADKNASKNGEVIEGREEERAF
jgi:hypothetical protein